MNKLLLAAVAGLLCVGVMDARLFRRGNGDCCPTRAARSCARPVATCATEARPPRCTKTIQVPETVMRDKVIEVQPEMVRTKNAPITVRHPQPCEEIKIPLPQQYRIEQRAVEDVIETIEVPDTISYRCPADTTSCGVAASCGRSAKSCCN